MPVTIRCYHELGQEARDHPSGLSHTRMYQWVKRQYPADQMDKEVHIKQGGSYAPSGCVVVEVNGREVIRLSWERLRFEMQEQL